MTFDTIALGTEYYTNKRDDESRSLQVIEPFSEQPIAVPRESSGPINPFSVGLVVPHRHWLHGGIYRIRHRSFSVSSSLLSV